MSRTSNPSKTVNPSRPARGKSVTVADRAAFIDRLEKTRTRIERQGEMLRTTKELEREIAERRG